MCVGGGAGGLMGGPGRATYLQKGGRMIVLQNQKSPLSTDFFIVKMNPFFSKH